MNWTFIEFIVLALLALVIMLAYYIRQAWMEIDDLLDKIDVLEEENDALDTEARKYKHRCQHYQVLAASDRRTAS